MIKTIEEFYSGSLRYAALFDAFAKKHNLEGRVLADHICYKCSSKEVFEEMRAVLEKESEYLYQSIISKRRIAYLKLKKPVETILGPIYFVELSDQKPDLSQRDGFDHIEAYPVGWSYEEMVLELEKTEKVIKNERPHHTTHDVEIGDGFVFRCTEEPLVEKIKRSEML